MSVLLFGCSSTTTPATTPPPGDTGSVDEVAAETSDDTADAAVEEVFDPDALPKPKTPVITGLMKMSGALHVMWSLNDTGITSEELWRNKDGAGYVLAYTFPDARNNFHDGEATGTSTYCFQVRTIRDGVSSDLSKEKCGTP